MTIVCAWCKAVIDTCNTDDELNVSHGICSKCRCRLFDESSTRVLKQIAKTITFPLMLVTGSGEIVAMESVGCVKPLIQMQKKEISIGEVLNCKRAAGTNRCGKTTFCHLCLIRKVIQKTYDTQMGVSNFPISLNSEDDSVSLYISTTYENSMVMVSCYQKV